jgi:hypothetical protein
MGVPPNSNAPATALAPTAPAATRPAEVNEIDILGFSFLETDTNNPKSRSLANHKMFH